MGTNNEHLLPFDLYTPLPLDCFKQLMGARQVHCPGVTLLPLLPLLPEERNHLEPLLPEESDYVEKPIGTRWNNTPFFGAIWPTSEWTALNNPLLPEGATPHPFDPLVPLRDGLLNDHLLPEGLTPFDLLPNDPL